MVQLNLTYYEKLMYFFLHLLKHVYECQGFSSNSVTLAAVSASEGVRDLSSSNYEHREWKAEMQCIAIAITHNFKFWGSISLNNMFNFIY
jgi:hypothetical protein